MITRKKNCLDFFPLCVSVWVFQLDLSENGDPQTSREKANSSVYASMSVFNFKQSENVQWCNGDKLTFKLFFEIKFMKMFIFSILQEKERVFWRVCIQIHTLSKNRFLFWYVF